MTQTSHFTAYPNGFGAYLIIYQSPITGRRWAYRCTDMEHVDNLKSDSPKRAMLDHLKANCKRGEYIPKTIKDREQISALLKRL